MKKLYLLLFLFLVLLTACETNMPLYKAYKPDNSIKNVDLQTVENIFYSDIGDFEKIIKVDNGRYIKLDSGMSEKITSCIDKLIDIKFNLNYIGIKKSNYESFMKTVKSNPEFDYESFINDFIQNKVVINVKAARILPGDFVREYEQNNKTFYILPLDIIIKTSSMDDTYFSKYPYFNKGDTIITGYLYCENDDAIKIIDWEESYKGETKASFNFVMK